MSELNRRMKRMADESRARVAEQEPAPVTHIYPRASDFYVRHMTVEDQCPLCGEVGGSELDRMWGKDFEREQTVGFWCDACDHEWSRPFELRPIFPSPWEWEKDAPDHWRAEREGYRTLTCWYSIQNESWMWEAWSAEQVSDEPVQYGQALTFEDVCKDAERWAEKDKALAERAIGGSE